MKGNKGEWAEAYVFLRLLAAGELSGYDDLDDVPAVCMPIIKIIRVEASTKRDYELIDSRVHIIDASSGKKVMEVSTERFVKEADILLDKIKNAEGSSNSFLKTEAFLNSIDVTQLKAKNIDKSDIKLIVHDAQTGQKPQLGYSIKSAISKPATLFNPAPGTNFIFKIIPPLNSSLDIAKLNFETIKQPRITSRVKELLDRGCEIKFDRVQSKNLSQNLSLIEERMAELLGHVLLIGYRTGKKNIRDILKTLNAENPMAYDLSSGHQFYEYRLKKFLTDAALGMTPEKVWSGSHDATGGFILVQPNGQLGCYHIHNKNNFEDYLINDTRLEQASTGEDKSNPGFAKPDAKKKYYWGWVFEEEGEFFLKINLQVRFQ